MKNNKTCVIQGMTAAANGAWRPVQAPVAPFSGGLIAVMVSLGAWRHTESIPEFSLSKSPVDVVRHELCDDCLHEFLDFSTGIFT